MIILDTAYKLMNERATAICKVTALVTKPARSSLGLVTVTGLLVVIGGVIITAAALTGQPLLKLVFGCILPAFSLTKLSVHLRQLFFSIE